MSYSPLHSGMAALLATECGFFCKIKNISMKEEGFEVRDMRHKEKFQVDDAYLNGYAKLCGIYALGVYNCLCRHANHLTQQSFPSVENMAEKLGVSRDSVLKGIKELEKWRIIKKEKSRSAKTGKWVHNSYTLVDKRFWVEKPSQVGNSDVVHQVGNSGSPSRPQRLSQVANIDSKDTHIKETHMKDIATTVAEKEINNALEAFKKINPSYEQLYKNKTQRAAAGRLIKKWGSQKLVDIIGFAAKANKMQYAPTIHTPLQLEEKMGALIDFAQKEKAKIETKKIIKL